MRLIFNCFHVNLLAVRYIKRKGRASMRILRLSDSMADEVWTLFYNSVHTLCRGEYTPEQLDAWAPADTDPHAWIEPMLDTYAIVAVEGEAIVGFGNIYPGRGYVDRLYVSPSVAGHGIGRTILTTLESQAECVLSVHASDTAKVFFLHSGYMTVRENIVERRGVVLRNWLMEKP